MALENRQKSSGKLLILKIKTKDAADKTVPVYIQVSEKIGEKWQASQDTVNSVKGDLTKIEVKERNYQGETYKTIGLYLTDKVAKETYLLDLRFNILTQGLLNSLFSLEAFNDVEVQVYQTKSGYPSSALTQAGNKTSWKFNKEELPAVKKVTLGKKTVTDTSDLEEFFLAELDKLRVKVEAANGKKSTKAGEAVSPANPEAEEDVPF